MKYYSKKPKEPEFSYRDLMYFKMVVFTEPNYLQRFGIIFMVSLSILFVTVWKFARFFSYLTSFKINVKIASAIDFLFLKIRHKFILRTMKPHIFGMTFKAIAMFTYAMFFERLFTLGAKF